MKNISKLLIVCPLPVFLLLPPIDAIFSATMPRKTLAESLLLLFCGWAVSRLCSWRRRASYAPAAVVAATLLFVFWMIPRSIDLTQIYPSVNAFYVVSLFTAGALLSHYLPLLPGVARVVYALYFSSMMVAIGLLYASQSTLLCSAYTLEDQHAFGWMLVALGLVAYLLVLVSMTRWLVPASESR
ncbi:MAG: hypothetical protein ACHQRJ_13030 [Alphaproteobacteria bacterium]